MVEGAVGLSVVEGGELCNEGMFRHLNLVCERLRKPGPTSPLDHFAHVYGSTVPYEFVQVPKREFILGSLTVLKSIDLVIHSEDE